MMQKVENRSLLVTTSVPGHHRPALLKQLKCQSAGIATPTVSRNCLGFPPPAETNLRCGKGARVGPNRRLIPQRFAAGPPFRLKPRHSSARFTKKAGGPRNLCDGSSVSQSTAASTRAKAELPTNYTRNDFVSIRLHEQRARTI